MSSRRKKTNPGIQASHVLAQLRHRYGTDYYTSAELQITKTPGRVDFLAIRPSFSNPEIHAFEIKVTRRDFLQDDKWPVYLEGSKQLWFATAPGIVEASEIPEQAGWLELSKNGARIFMRKKAPMRSMTPEAEAQLYKRVIHQDFYGKTPISQGGESDSRDMKALQAWVADKSAKKDLSHHVNRKIRVAFAEQEARIVEQTARNDRLQVIADFLEARGIDPLRLPRYQHGTFLEQALRQADPGIFDDEGEQALKTISRAARHLEQAATEHATRIRNACDTAMKAIEAAKPTDSEAETGD